MPADREARWSIRLAALAVAAVWAAEAVESSPGAARRPDPAGGSGSPNVKLFDTGAASAEPPPPAALTARRGWTEVPAGKAGQAFKGDAVVMNDRLAVVLRPKAGAAEMYAASGDGAAAWSRRASLVPLSSKGAPAGPIAGIRTAEVAGGAAAVQAAFAGSGGAAGSKGTSLGLELGPGQVFVSVRPGEGLGGLRLQAPCRYVVLPDFFADDIALDAADLAAAKAELPADNFLMHMVGRGESIVLAVRDPAEADVDVALSGDGENRRVESSDIPIGKGGKAWVGLLEAAGIWHVHSLAADQAGKVIPLDWKMPFPAQWRVDWRKDDGLVDSWEMLLERPDGRFTKYAWFGSPGTLPPNRNRWNTVLGSFAYPCWVDTAGQGRLQPLKRVLRFQGPAVIYPIHRVPDTPLTAFTVADVVQAALGVGPCQYILDLEGQKNTYKGIATCGCRDTLNPIYDKHQQKEQRARIEKTLKDVIAFIRHIRGRIEEYVEFSRQIRAYLAEQKKAHPDLAGPLKEMETLAAAMDKYLEARREKIKTPEYAESLVEKFRAEMLDYDGPDALARCKKYTEAWVEIGGNQDELVGEGRLVARLLRQRASLLMASEPRLAEIAREVRRRSQQVLRNPAGHEGARH